MMWATWIEYALIYSNLPTYLLYRSQHQKVLPEVRNKIPFSNCVFPPSFSSRWKSWACDIVLVRLLQYQ